MMKFLHKYVSVCVIVCWAIVVAAPVAFAVQETFGTYLLALVQATFVAQTDSLYINQGGVSKQVTSAIYAQSLGITLPTDELNFASGLYTGGCTSLASCVTVTNSGGYAQWVDGHWSNFSSNTARITDQGILREPASTNLALNSRDLSQSSWTKTNLTSALTATGIDNGTNDASTLTATAANGTACQSITNGGGSFGEFTFTVFLKRVTGTGEVDLSLEAAPGHSGTVWYPITQAGQVPALTTGWQRFQLTFPTMVNPTFCVRLVTNTDVVAADFGQVENQVWATSPIVTTGTTATRSVDVVQLTGAAATLLNSGIATVIATESGVNAGNFRHQIASPVLGGSTLDLYSWQYAANAVFDNPGSTPAGATPFTICGPTTTIDANQSLALPVIYGMTWTSSTFSMDCDGAATFVGPGSPPTSQTWYLGTATSAPTSYESDLKLFNTSFSIAALQAATTKSNKFQITDASPPSGEWNNFTAANGTSLIGGVNPPGGGGTQFTYTFESGLGTSGVTYPIQIGQSGNMMRFNMFANNCWVSDDCQVGSYGGSQRSEMDGAGSAQFANGAEIWMSYSDCNEPGPPITSNWFIEGQVHQTINSSAGGSPPFLISGGIGEYRYVSFVNDGLQTYQTAYSWPIVRGRWENMVLDMIMDPSGATGKFNVWRNGVQVVAYTGKTGTTPTGGTENYYWKFGIYESQVPEYQAVRYANMTYSTSSLASKVASPDAIPSGYGTTCQ